MHTIEDAIKRIYERSNEISSFDRSFVADMYDLDLSGKSYTTKQLAVCVKIISNHKYLFDASERIDELIVSQRCKRTPKLSIEVVDEVRYAGGNLLLMRTKYSSQRMKAFKQLNETDVIRGMSYLGDSGYSYFDHTTKIWCVRVTQYNLGKVMKIIKTFNIQFDDSVVAFLTECENSRSLRSHASVDGDQINIIVRNDTILSNWLTQVAWEEDNV